MCLGVFSALKDDRLEVPSIPRSTPSKMDAEGLGPKLLLTPSGDTRRAPDKQTVGTVTASHKMLTCRQIWRVAGRESGSPELLGSPRTSPEVPRTSPEVFSATSPEVLSPWNLNNNPELPRKFPKLPRKFPDFPGGQPLSLGSLTPSPDSQKLFSSSSNPAITFELSQCRRCKEGLPVDQRVLTGLCAVPTRLLIGCVWLGAELPSNFDNGTPQAECQDIRVETKR